jgi:tripeptide aminopeptidase
MNRQLLRILEIQSESYNSKKMSNYIIGRLSSEGIKVEKDVSGNIYATKGDADIYPCVVSHIDTVHSIVPEENYKVVEVDNKIFAIDPVTMKFTGVGGDDKCGIYICIELMKRVKNIKAVFFVDEEVGCVGSSQADLSFFDNVGYLIQADRKGYADVVSELCGVKVASDAFMQTIEPVMQSYLKEECKNGGLTDIYQLKTSGVDVSAINLSCAYYNPHQDNEYIDFNQLTFTLEFAHEIIELLGEVKYPQVAERKPNSYGYGYGYSSWDYDYPTYKYDGFGVGKKTPYVSKPINEIDETPESCSDCNSKDIYVNEGKENGFVYCHNCYNIEYNYKSEDYATVKNNL